MPREDRTEKATPKHRKRAREKGQVARSSDLSGSVVVIAGLLAISLMGPRIADAGAATFREIFGEISQSGQATSASRPGRTDALGAVDDRARGRAGRRRVHGRRRRSPASPRSASGRAPRPLKPDFRRINPVSGLKNLLGPNAVFEAIKTVAKVGVVGAVAALALLPGLTGLAAVVGISTLGLGALAGGKRSGSPSTRPSPTC